MARISRVDGLAMQHHSGSQGKHNGVIFEDPSLDKGANITIQTEDTRNLLALLNHYGHNPHLILFALDETA